MAEEEDEEEERVEEEEDGGGSEASLSPVSQLMAVDLSVPSHVTLVAHAVQAVHKARGGRLRIAILHLPARFDAAAAAAAAAFSAATDAAAATAAAADAATAADAGALRHAAAAAAWEALVGGATPPMLTEVRLRIIYIYICTFI